jgi:hypothetical protein
MNSRSDPLRSQPRVRGDGPDGAGRAVRAAKGRGSADPPAAVPRRARGGHTPAAGLEPAAEAARHSVKALAHIHFTELIAMDKDSPIRKIGFPVVGEKPLPAGEQHGLPALAG